MIKTTPIVFSTLVTAASLTLVCQSVTASAEIYGVNNAGMIGLNTVPSARMDAPGTVRLGTGTLDPYLHGFLGFQVAEPLYVSVRQSAEASNINEDADRLYPGLDLKLRLMEETRSRPSVVIGLQSAVGHKRMAGEYIALSKRLYDFDLTAGMGWGRYGTASHFKNPLKGLHDHFGKPRALDGEMPNEPANWFTGENVGLFAGVEYFTPFDGLSLMADWGAARYSAEKAAFDYDPPAQWSLGLRYSPQDWITLALGMQGTDKVMGRLSFQGNVRHWPDRDKSYKRPTPMRPYRTGLALPAQMEISAARDDVRLYNARQDTYHVASADLVLQSGRSAPAQIGEALTHMSNHGGPATEALSLTPRIMGLRGPKITILRRDAMAAMAHNTGSAEEIWQNAEFDSEGRGISAVGLLKSERIREHHASRQNFFLTLKTEGSLAEEDSGLLYRSALIGGARYTRFMGILDGGYSLRLNLSDNLDRLRDIRPPAVLPVRSNIDQFAERTVALETLYTSYTHSFTPHWHMALTGGYLEEMYAGLGGEALYRPFGPRFALGAEAWLAFKRDPFTSLNMGLNGDRLLTGHVNAWYDMPHWDVTLKASAGRYLAEDIGGSLALEKTYANGAHLSGFVIFTDQADFDLFGGTTHAYHGVKLSLPLGGVNQNLRGVTVDTTAAPLGRDTGQRLEKPFDLYEVTRPFSKAHMIQNWDKITD